MDQRGVSIATFGYSYDCCHGTGKMAKSRRSIVRTGLAAPPEKSKAPLRGLLFFSPSVVEDENPVRPTQQRSCQLAGQRRRRKSQNALAFWTHEVRPEGVRIAERRFESIPPFPSPMTIACPCQALRASPNLLFLCEFVGTKLGQNLVPFNE
jgi:hypothetical protein